MLPSLFPGSISTGHLLGICPLCCSRWWLLWRPHQLGQSFLIKFNNPRPCRHPASHPHSLKSCLWFMIPQRSAPKNYLKSKFLLISKAFYWTFAIFDARTRGIPARALLQTITWWRGGSVGGLQCSSGWWLPAMTLASTSISLRIKVACTKPLFSIGQSFERHKKRSLLIVLRCTGSVNLFKASALSRTGNTDHYDVLVRVMKWSAIRIKRC